MIYINYYIKYFILFLCSLIIMLKLINYNYRKNIKLVIIFSIINTSLFMLLKDYVGMLIALLFLVIILGIELIKFSSKTKFLNLVYSLISFTICIIIYTLIILPFVGMISYFLFNNPAPTFLDYRIIDVLTLLCVHKLLKAKKLKNGLSIFKNEYKLEHLLLFLMISLIIIISSIILWQYYMKRQLFNDYADYYFVIILVLMSILIVVSIFREINNHYRNTANERTINNLNEIIKKQNQEITRLTKVSKISHKTNHKIDILKSNINKMTKKEAINKLNELSINYHNEVKNINKLSLLKSTNIHEIDEVLNYIQTKTNENNIDFVLIINGSVNYMIQNYIDKQSLATLLSDHLKNAIIAINHSKNKYKSITLTLGEIGDYYGIAIHDTGIPFKINTLVNLGLKMVTTHKKEGGTGIGFVTTFELLKKLKASITIEEKFPEENNYTKSIIILFDDKNEYKIKSYRQNEIEEKNTKNKITYIK